MREQKSLTPTLDWFTIFLYIGLVIFGWINIYAAVYDPETQKSIFDFSINSGKQLIWIFSAAVLAILIMAVDYKFFDTFAIPMYVLTLVLLIGVLFFGREIAGNKSWFDLGFMRLQPSEFAKVATSLALAKYLQSTNAKIDNIKTFVIVSAILIVPVALIQLQGDTGSALVYAAFIVVFYREGLPSFIMTLGILLVLLFIATLFFREHYIIHLMVGIGVIGLLYILFSKKNKQNILMSVSGCAIAIMLVMSVDFIISDVMKPHQRQRIEILVDPDGDPLGAGWQVTQSKIAIGSGGIIGKGFLKGTQTKFDFVPDQSTDFIFCTVGEEHGWLGSLVVIVAFVVLLFRIVSIAERQKARFSRVYGYSVACILFFHFMINIGMTIGIFPVIGIPLPMFSYGGSSLWSFTILLFILIKLDAHRMQVLSRN